MAELLIVDHRMEWAPGRSPGVDGYRWRVEVEGCGTLLVDVSGSEAVRGGMATRELDEELPTACSDTRPRDSTPLLRRSISSDNETPPWCCSLSTFSADALLPLHGSRIALLREQAASAA